jgi:predicted permease
MSAAIRLDLRYAIRTLRKSHGFASVAFITLALAIGANTAIFTLVDSLVLRPLPIRDPAKFVSLRLFTHDRRPTQVSYKAFRDLASRQQVFSGIFAYDDNGLNDFQLDQTAWHGARLTVTGDFYSTTGVRPFMGRGITPDDLNPGAPPVAVISYEVWKDRLGSDSSIIGKTLKVQDAAFTIVGVTPANFFGLYVGISADVTVPVTTIGLFTLGGPNWLETANWLDVAARLKPEISPKQAQAQVNSIWPRLLADERAGLTDQQQEWLPAHAEVSPAGTGFTSLRVRFSRPLFMLMSMVILVLALACMNLSVLMLARAAARKYEMAVRIALGASRHRIVQQLLTETLLLSITGAIAGVLLSMWMSRAVASFLWTGLVPMSLNLRPDGRILTFAIASTLLTGTLFGLVPGWRAARHDPTLVLHGATGAGAPAGRFGKALVVSQLIISGVLLAGAWTLVGHLRHIRSLPLGFDSGKVLTMQLLNRPGAYRNLDHSVYDRELLQRVSDANGVQCATLSKGAFLTGRDFTRPVSGSAAAAVSTMALYGLVSPDFFRTLGMQIEEGRDFDWHDDAHSPPVAIMTASLAHELFPHGDPLGSSIRMGNESYTVVGVVSDARLGDVRNQTPAVFFALFQKPEQIVQPLLEVRSVGDPAAIASSVRKAVESLGREYALKTETLQHAVDQQLISERMIATLASGFGALAFLLAVISIYGLISYNVSQRTSEIGVRLALGATRRNLVELVGREICALLLVGEALTLPIAWVAMRVLPHFLTGVRPQFTSLLASEMLLGIAAILAAYTPTRRALRLNPMVALRQE